MRMKDDVELERERENSLVSQSRLVSERQVKSFILLASGQVLMLYFFKSRATRKAKNRSIHQSAILLIQLISIAHFRVCLFEFACVCV